MRGEESELLNYMKLYKTNIKQNIMLINCIQQEFKKLF